MKDLVFINGPMGVGKSTVAQPLKKMLAPCVYLDGDWCWDMHPFVANQLNRVMVLDNAAYLLNQFLRNPGYQRVIFTWVMQYEDIMKGLLEKIDQPYRLHCFTLLCSRETLLEHLQKDIALGKRSQDILERALDYLPLYERMETDKIMVQGKMPQQVAQEIAECVQRRCGAVQGEER